jgi:outer membrane protein TolC
MKTMSSRHTSRPILSSWCHALIGAAAILLSACAIHPMPFTDAERVTAAHAGRTEMIGQQEAINGPITLDEAMARAIHYNLDHRLKMMEEALAQKQLDLSNFELLPKLTTAAGYTARDRLLASRSVGLATGSTTVPPSYSSDKTDRTYDVGFAWNLLDFGVSYYEAKEGADQVLMVGQERRKVIQLMMQQVREAYWQTAGAQRLHERIEPLFEQARAALDDSRQAQHEQLRAPLVTLNYQRQLLEIMRQLEVVRGHLNEAMPRLASLMDLEPGTNFTLAPEEGFILPQFQMPIEQMEETALERRPDLLEAHYNERISINEAHKALVKLLPGIELSVGAHYDSNSFLSYSTWQDAGIRVTWNLMNLLNARNIRQTADAQLAVAHEKRLSLTMAVLTQVHVAQSDLDAKRQEFELMRQLNEVDQQILLHTRNAAEANAEGKLEEIRTATDAMIAELRVYETYGELQSTYGSLLATLGLDPVPDSVAGHDLATLEQSIVQEQQHWAELGHASGRPQ